MSPVRQVLGRQVEHGRHAGAGALFEVGPGVDVHVAVDETRQEYPAGPVDRLGVRRAHHVVGDKSIVDDNRAWLRHPRTVEDADVGEHSGGSSSDALFLGEFVQVEAWEPVISAARSSGCRNDGGGGGPQAKRPAAPSRSSGVHSWSSTMQSMSE